MRRPLADRTVVLWGTVICVLVGFALRAHLLGTDGRFHADEALFAAFARNAAARGEWALPGDLDKTPLSIYAQAVSMVLVGMEWDGAVWRVLLLRGEFAARLVGIYAGAMLVAAVVRLAYTSGAGRGALLAGLIVALSPYGIAFSPTAFTDMPMILCVTLALLTAQRGQAVWAGVWLMLGYACKQQAVLFAPLVVLLLAWGTVGSGTLRARSALQRRLGAFVASVAVGVGILALWDAARPYPSVLLLATQNNAPDRLLVTMGNLLPRLRTWAGLWGWLLGGAFVTYPVLGWCCWRMWWTRRTLPPVTWALLLFALGYMLLHWLVPLNTYDRYVLPLLPLTAVLIALVIRERVLLVAVLLAALMLPVAWRAANGRVPIGGDDGANDGIIELADYLNGREFGAIIYDHWTGWQLNYYLGAWTDKRRAYYPNPHALTADAALYTPDVAPRYLPAPHTANVLPWLAALDAAGFSACISFVNHNFAVYVLAPITDDGTNAAALAQAACEQQ